MKKLKYIYLFFAFTGVGLFSPCSYADFDRNDDAWCGYREYYNGGFNSWANQGYYGSEIPNGLAWTLFGLGVASLLAGPISDTYSDATPIFGSYGYEQPLISDYYYQGYNPSQYYPSEGTIVYSYNQLTGFYNNEIVSAPTVVLESVPSVILNFGSPYNSGYGWGGYGWGGYGWGGNPNVNNNTYNNYTQKTYNYYNNSPSPSQTAERFNEGTPKQQNIHSKEQHHNRNSLYNAQQSYLSRGDVSSYNKTSVEKIPRFGKKSIHEAQQNYHQVENITTQKNPFRSSMQNGGEFQKLSRDNRNPQASFQDLASSKAGRYNINKKYASSEDSKQANKSLSLSQAQQNYRQEGSLKNASHRINEGGINETGTEALRSTAINNRYPQANEPSGVSTDFRNAHPGFHGIDPTKYLRNSSINNDETGMPQKVSSNKHFSQNRVQQNLGQGNEISRPASSSMNAHPGFHGIDPTQYANYSNHQNSGAPRSSQNPLENSKSTGSQGASPVNYSRNSYRNNNSNGASTANPALPRYSDHPVSSGNNNFAGRGEGRKTLTGQLHSSTPPQARYAQSHQTAYSNANASAREAKAKQGTSDHASGYNTNSHKK